MHYFVMAREGEGEWASQTVLSSVSWNAAPGYCCSIETHVDESDFTDFSLEQSFGRSVHHAVQLKQASKPYWAWAHSKKYIWLLKNILVSSAFSNETRTDKQFVMSDFTQYLLLFANCPDQLCTPSHASTHEHTLYWLQQEHKHWKILIWCYLFWKKIIENCLDKLISFLWTKKNKLKL